MAKLSAQVIKAAGSDERVELADEPVHAEQTWVSVVRDRTRSTCPTRRRPALLADWSARLLAADGVSHVDASLLTVHENKFYADTAGHRHHPAAGPAASAADRRRGRRVERRVRLDAHASRRRSGRGWEYLTGTGWDWDAELERIPELLAEKMRAPSVEAGAYDLVVDPSNLWLTIHESIGHATELDRALGYEAAYAGTSFATFDQLGKLRYGSELMNVTGDRTAEHGLATIGYDDEGVAGAVLGPGQGRHPGRLPAGPPDREADRPRPVQRLRVRRLPRPRAGAADGERVAAAGSGRARPPRT